MPSLERTNSSSFRLLVCSGFSIVLPYFACFSRFPSRSGKQKDNAVHLIPLVLSTLFTFLLIFYLLPHPALTTRESERGAGQLLSSNMIAARSNHRLANALERSSIAAADKISYEAGSKMRDKNVLA